MKYDPEKHHRRSIRLKGYDYTQIGAYFVTVVTKNRECLFGEVIEGETRLNNAGQVIERWWVELNHKFSMVETKEFVVMPNHFHGIVVIPVGADLPACRPWIERRTHRPSGRTRKCAPTNGYPMV